MYPALTLPSALRRLDMCVVLLAGPYDAILVRSRLLVPELVSSISSRVSMGFRHVYPVIIARSVVLFIFAAC
jgi:hypothetical protein